MPVHTQSLVASDMIQFPDLFRAREGENLTSVGNLVRIDMSCAWYL